MNIKKGDTVIMLNGKDRLKKGKVLSASPSADKILVEGLNLVKRHQRPRQEGQKGQIISKERAVSVSNVQLICPKCGQPTRIGHAVHGDSKARTCKKCQAEF